MFSHCFIPLISQGMQQNIKSAIAIINCMLSHYFIFRDIYFIMAVIGYFNRWKGSWPVVKFSHLFLAKYDIKHDTQIITFLFPSISLIDRCAHASVNNSCATRNSENSNCWFQHIVDFNIFSISTYFPTIQNGCVLIKRSPRVPQ